MSSPAAAPAPDTSAKDAAAPAGKSLIKKLKVPGIIVLVVVAEWVAAALFLPGGGPSSPSAAAPAGEKAAASEDEAQGAGHDEASAEQAGSHGKAEDAGHEAAAAKGGHAPAHGKDDKGHGDKAEAGPAKPASKPFSDETEADLGEFTVTVFQHASSSTQFISFHLYGTVKRRNMETFNARFEESKHRIRDNVIVIVRSAEMTDLTDAGLGLIKRRILETTNRTLGKPLLQGVVFSDFSFVEQ